MENKKFDFNQYAYINIDQDLASYALTTDEEIIEMLTQKDEEAEAEDEPVAKENQIRGSDKPISNQEAFKMIDRLRDYCAHRKDDLSKALQNLNDFEKHIQENIVMCQPKITNFL